MSLVGWTSSIDTLSLLMPLESLPERDWASLSPLAKTLTPSDFNERYKGNFLDGDLSPRAYYIGEAVTVCTACIRDYYPTDDGELARKTQDSIFAIFAYDWRDVVLLQVCATCKRTLGESHRERIKEVEWLGDGF